MKEIQNDRRTYENLAGQHDGKKLYQSIISSDLASLRPRWSNLLKLESIDSVIFVGSSASGKSTIHDVVHTAATVDSVLAGKISVPRRIITRSPRPDDGDEIVYANPVELSIQAARGEVGLYGIKTMEGGRTEPFALEKPEHSPVLFANNVVVKNPENILYPKSIFESGLVVGIYTPDRIREVRLRDRSSELSQTKPEEFAFRLSEEERSAVVIPKAHIIVKNFGSYEKRSSADVISLLKLVVRN